MQLKHTRKAITHQLENMLPQMKGIKFVETLRVTFEKKLGREERIMKTAYFNSQPHVIVNKAQAEAVLTTAAQEILNIVAVWLSEGSGWSVQEIDNHYINLVQFKPTVGSSYIELPKELQNSLKGLINIKNEDNECFRWRHIRHMNPQKKNPQRIKKTDKTFVDILDYSGIDFPVTANQYNKIEKQNKIRINFFGYDKGEKYPLYLSKEKHTDCLNLLVISEDNKKHYVLITDFDRFMYDITKNKQKQHFCMYCLQHFRTKTTLNKHTENCFEINGAQAIKMPDKDNNIVKFLNEKREKPVPFVIYADFEAITEKVHGCAPNDEKSYTEAYQKHTDCGYGYRGCVLL